MIKQAQSKIEPTCPIEGPIEEPIVESKVRDSFFNLINKGEYTNENRFK